jgi:hypothetical protein
MPDKPPRRSLFSVIGQLDEIRNLQREKLDAQPLEPALAVLKAWQSQRLARTYADLLATARYGLACRFFLDDIYAARDFAQRDRDINEMYAFMQRFVPAGLLKPLEETIQLYGLTQALDQRLRDVLVDELGVTDSITEAQYAEGYRRCDNYTERVRQIDKIVEIGSLLDVIIGLPLTGTALQVAKVPANRAGWTELTGFMERGYRAFKQMRGANEFLDAIRRRERTILDRIYAEEPEPFKVD